jgi:hypothetical protein
MDDLRVVPFFLGGKERQLDQGKAKDRANSPVVHVETVDSAEKPGLANFGGALRATPIDREAVEQNSPGLQAWEPTPAGMRPEGAPHVARPTALATAAWANFIGRRGAIHASTPGLTLLSTLCVLNQGKTRTMYQSLEGSRLRLPRRCQQRAPGENRPAL